MKKVLVYEKLQVEQYVTELQDYWKDNQAVFKLDSVSFLYIWGSICYWTAYRIEFSIILWIWIPIQSIIIYTAKNRIQRFIYIIPFYILSFLSMGL